MNEIFENAKQQRKGVINMVYDIKSASPQNIAEVLHQLKESDKTAVICGSEKLSFKELWEGAENAARNLIDRGVKKGDRITLMMKSSVDYVCVLIGAAMAGVICVSLDVNWPQKQKDRVTADCKPVMNVDNNTAHSIVKGGSDKGYDINISDVSGSDVFFIVYTSGSTGTPKGVVVTHLALINACSSAEENVRNHSFAANCKCMLADASFAFVASNYFIMLALLNELTVVIATEEERNSYSALAKSIINNEIDAFFRTPSWVIKGLDNKEFADAVCNIRVISLGGEKITKQSVDAILKYMPNAELFCSYGSSEVLACSEHRYTEGEEDIIGCAHANAPLYVLDESGRDVNDGEMGELCIGGIPAALGRYYNAPELTESRYTIHPKYGRIFHTHDNVLKESSDKIHFVGRDDGMIKLHGIRIEPEMIEEAMRRIPEIELAAVCAVGEKNAVSLAAYYTFVNDAAVLPSEYDIRRFLINELPYYMVPSFLVQLEKMPMNSSGKIDRRSLSVKKYHRDMFKSPVTSSEKLICSCFKKVLDIPDPIGVNESFFDLGGDSLSGMKLMELLENEGYHIEIKELFAAPTPALLAKLIKSGGSKETAKMPDDSTYSEPHIGKCEIPADNIKCVFPLKKIVRERAAAGDDWICFDIWETDVKLTREEFEKRITELTEAHCALRTVIVKDENGVPVQAVLKKHKPDLFYVDLSGQSQYADEISEKQKKYFDFLIKMQMVQPASISGNVAFQVGFVRLSECKSIIYFRYSHLLLDGISMYCIVKEIIGESVAADDENILKNYAARMSSNRNDEAEAYLKKIKLSSQKIVALPKSGSKGSALPNVFAIGDKETYNRALSICETRNITFAALLHYCIGSVLCDTLGLRECCFWTTVSGRSPSESNVPGMFVQRVPFIFKFTDTPESCQEQLINISQYAWVYEFSDMQPSEAEENAGLVLDVFSYYKPTDKLRWSGPDEVMSSFDIRNNIIPLSEILARSGMPTIFSEKKGEHLCAGIYDANRISPQYMDRLADNTASKVNVLYVEDLSKLRTIRDILMWYGRKMPGKVIFRYLSSKGEQTVATRDFMRSVWALGTWLYKQDMYECRIAIIGKNSCEWLLALFAVVCGKNTAVFIDPELSADEVSKRLEQVNADAAFIEDELIEKYSQSKSAEYISSIRKIVFSELDGFVKQGEKLLNDGDTSFEDNTPTEEDDAVILFTTGTTGSGKAVPLTHKNIVVSCAVTCPHFNHYNRMLLALPLFHIGGFSTILLPCLLARTEICMIGDYRYFMQSVLTMKCQYATLVPRLAELILTWYEGQDPDTDVHRQYPGFKLEEITLTGTTVSSNSAEDFRKYGISVIEGYGMTESSGAILVRGKPVEKMEIKLDGGGECGEIMVKGPMVFRGYLNDPEATSSAFDDGWFRTGDIGCRRSDGSYAIIGRAKNVIILSNGENVSPEELEKSLENTPYISECMVFAENDIIAVCVVPNEEVCGSSQEDVDAVIHNTVETLNENNPSYMRIDKIIIRREPLPRNKLGKLIRGIDI